MDSTSAQILDKNISKMREARPLNKSQLVTDKDDFRKEVRRNLGMHGKSALEFQDLKHK
jgi:hypothetical protein